MRRIILLLTLVITILLCSCQSKDGSSGQPSVNPPSPVAVDLSGNGKAVKNIGMDELRNNSFDKQSSRNLDKSEGIKLTPKSQPEKDPIKVLIAYFSRTDNTETVAKYIQTLTGGELFEIKTVKPYPDDYKACLKQASKELAADYRPKLSTHVSDISDYDVVFVGFQFGMTTRQWQYALF